MGRGEDGKAADILWESGGAFRVMLSGTGGSGVMLLTG